MDWPLDPGSLSPAEAQLEAKRLAKQLLAAGGTDSGAIMRGVVEGLRLPVHAPDTFDREATLTRLRSHIELMLLVQLELGKMETALSPPTEDN